MIILESQCVIFVGIRLLFYEHSITAVNDIHYCKSNNKDSVPSSIFNYIYF